MKQDNQNPESSQVGIGATVTPVQASVNKWTEGMEVKHPGFKEAYDAGVRLNEVPETARANRTLLDRYSDGIADKQIELYEKEQITDKVDDRAAALVRQRFSELERFEKALTDRDVTTRLDRHEETLPPKAEGGGSSNAEQIAEVARKAAEEKGFSPTAQYTIAKAARERVEALERGGVQAAIAKFDHDTEGTRTRVASVSTKAVDIGNFER